MTPPAGRAVLSGRGRAVIGQPGTGAAGYRAGPVWAWFLPPALMLALGLWGITGASYWRDEAATMTAVQRPFGELLRMMGHVDAVHGLRRGGGGRAGPAAGVPGGRAGGRAALRGAAAGQPVRPGCQGIRAHCGAGRYRELPAGPGDDDRGAAAGLDGGLRGVPGRDGPAERVQPAAGRGARDHGRPGLAPGRAVAGGGLAGRGGGRVPDREPGARARVRP